MFGFLELFGLLPRDVHLFELELEKHREFCLRTSWAVATAFALGIAIIWAMLSAYLDQIGAFCEKNMFQRSGAILVAAALPFDIAISRMPARFPYISIPEDQPEFRSFNLKLTDKRIQRFKAIGGVIGALLTIFGTLVWAYGDLLIASTEC